MVSLQEKKIRAEVLKNQTMGTKETLSSKKKMTLIETNWKRTGEYEYEPTEWTNLPVIPFEDVKQFIKDLKEELENGYMTRTRIKTIIDTLAGEELLEESS